MLFTVSTRYGTEHFLSEGEARTYAARWSELLQGRFTLWVDDGVGERVIALFANGDEQEQAA